MNSLPLFLQLGDQKVNIHRIHILREMPPGPSGVPSVSVDMGTRSWTWTPKDRSELGWFYQAIGVLRPGELPARLAAACSLEPLQTSARPARRKS